MLYVDMAANGEPLKVFVDSGAQMTIMTQPCAEKCNIMRLVDKRVAGMAVGVGSNKILGRIHACELKVPPLTASLLSLSLSPSLSLSVSLSFSLSPSISLPLFLPSSCSLSASVHRQRERCLWLRL